MTVTRVLVVCTANVCRSPMAEQLLRHRLGDARVEVASAGVAARSGQPMSPLAQAVLREVGVPVLTHESRRLEPELVTAADLVLTATREHRTAVVGESPRALRRTFTIRELARLARAAGAGGPDGPRVPDVARLRGAVPPHDPGADDLDDPHGGPRAGYLACRDLLMADLDAIAPLLR